MIYYESRTPENIWSKKALTSDVEEFIEEMRGKRG